VVIASTLDHVVDRAREAVWLSRYGRRLTDQEGQRLLQIVRRGKHESVRVRRAMIIVAAATTRSEKLGQPFTRWSLRKLADYLACRPGGPVTIGRERLRQILHERGTSFQRTRTWKESTDQDRDAKLDRIEHVTSAYPDRCFASDQFGRCPSARATAPAGRGANTPSGSARLTIARTASATSTAATAWVMTSCGP
jgi:hypothetical protein